MLGRIQSHYQRVKALYKEYERVLMPALIAWGFIFHYITFRIISVTDILYLVFDYLILATLTIFFIDLYDQGLIREKFRYVRLFAPLLLQFTLGSIIGGVFIFYWFSGSVAVSWPFITLVVVILVGLEFYKHYLENPIVQLALYDFAAFLMLAVALPFIFRSINPGLFIMAGVISLALVFGILWSLKKSPAIQNYKTKIIIVCVAIFAIMNVFYFYNFIPPVPLSIRDSGVYHDVQFSSGHYTVDSEKESFWQHFKLTPTYHLASGERIFVFSSIYSPDDLDTDIVYDWQFYDTTQDKWIDKGKTSSHLIGGRQGGYGGYSYRINPAAGKWRVYIETPRGQVLGRHVFDVQTVSQTPALQTEIR
ncbi:MAG TPA: DUF2914 domain-containing protein [Candidatus Paceibacterota bacterium]|nr:DUF2914 domain-containing protein [Candidatus Paceibacterota bacterium]